MLHEDNISRNVCVCFFFFLIICYASERIKRLQCKRQPHAINSEDPKRVLIFDGCIITSRSIRRGRYAQSSCDFTVYVESRYRLKRDLYHDLYRKKKKEKKILRTTPTASLAFSELIATTVLGGVVLRRNFESSISHTFL